MARASTRINTGKATLMWPKLVKAEVNGMKPEGSAKEYGATFVFKKGSPELKKLEDALESLIDIDFTDGEADDQNFKYPVKDGDAFNKKRVKKGKEPIAAMEGCAYIQPFMSEEDGAPDLYDGQTALKDRADGTKLFYSGAQVAPLLNLFTYDNKFGCGLSMRLIGAQFFSHGEKLGGGGGGPTNDLLASDASGTGAEASAKPEGSKSRRSRVSEDEADMDFN